MRYYLLVNNGTIGIQHLDLVLSPRGVLISVEDCKGLVTLNSRQIL